MNKCDLENLIGAGLSTHSMARELGCSQTNVMYWLKKHGLSTAVPTKRFSCSVCGAQIGRRSRYCGNECFSIAQARIVVSEWIGNGQSALPEYMSVSGFLKAGVRREFFERRGNACERCGWTHKFGDGSLPPLHVAHKNHVYSDMRYNNLELLCPNCHAIETREQPVPKGSGRWAGAEEGEKNDS